MTIIILIFLFCLGLIIGSFLNVIIYRLPAKESIIFPGSHCRFCKKRIPFYDNIPILSYIILRGRCRYCGHRISLQYPLVEFVSGAILPLTFYYYGFSVDFFAAVLFLYLLLPLFVIDLRHRLVPDKITFPGIIVGAGFPFFSDKIHWYESLLGIGVGGGLLLLIAFLGRRVFKKEAMGMGDVTLFMMVGAFIGWKGVLLTLILASFVGSIVGIIVIAKKKSKDTTLPFGPFICIAATFSYFWGHILINKYLSFFG